LSLGDKQYAQAAIDANGGFFCGTAYS